jgi:hypothetical protein
MFGLIGTLPIVYPPRRLPSGAIRPPTLVEGCHYLRLDRSSPAFQQVSFVAYEACPAFVIVVQADGRRVRCPRQELWEILQPISIETESNGAALEREDDHP